MGVDHRTTHQTEPNPDRHPPRSLRFDIQDHRQLGLLLGTFVELSGELAIQSRIGSRAAAFP